MLHRSARIAGAPRLPRGSESPEADDVAHPPKRSESSNRSWSLTASTVLPLGVAIGATGCSGKSSSSADGVRATGGSTGTEPAATGGMAGAPAEASARGGTTAGADDVTAGAGGTAFLFFHMIPGNGSSDGHLTLMKQPERLMNQTVDWFKMTLGGDTLAKNKFVGPSCEYCGHDSE